MCEINARPGVELRGFAPAPPISMLKLQVWTALQLYKIGRLFRTAEPLKLDVAFATLRSGGRGADNLLFDVAGVYFAHT